MSPSINNTLPLIVTSLNLLWWQSSHLCCLINMCSEGQTEGDSIKDKTYQGNLLVSLEQKCLICSNTTIKEGTTYWNALEPSMPYSSVSYPHTPFLTTIFSFTFWLPTFLWLSSFSGLDWLWTPLALKLALTLDFIYLLYYYYIYLLYYYYIIILYYYIIIIIIIIYIYYIYIIYIYIKFLLEYCWLKMC